MFGRFLVSKTKSAYDQAYDTSPLRRAEAVEQLFLADQLQYIRYKQLIEKTLRRPMIRLAAVPHLCHIRPEKWRRFYE